MAGVTDLAFRRLARRMGAALAVSEMVTSDRSLWHTAKSRTRLAHEGEPAPRSVQIAGRDPAMLADAARANVDQGADIIDINMGCPAKKVCNALCGSALLADEPLVARILDAVVAAVDVPVTLKIRTGPDPANRNAVTMPLLVNGDIRSPADAAAALRHTGADAVMIGRAAQGDPWLLGRTQHYLDTGELLPPPSAAEVAAVMDEHLLGLYALYGERQGVRIARKHLSWYGKGRPGAGAWWSRVNRVECAHTQRTLVAELFAGSGITGAAA